MKRIVLFLLVIIVIAAAVGAWLFLGSGTSFQIKSTPLYVYTGKANKAAVVAFMEENNVVAHPQLFALLADRMEVWDRLKPGRFVIKKGESLLNIARMLRNNRQTPVNLVINKLRTKEDLARLIGKQFEVDSLEVLTFLNTPDSLKMLNLDTNIAMTMVIPNTYSIFWNTPVNKIFERLNKEQQSFWDKKERLEKAGSLSLTPQQVYTIASIVEEETNKQDEKGNVASVYINRYFKGMPLGADPTVKFALKDFGLKRIYQKHLLVESPYNTYRYTGIPPGPICTPSSRTIDAVLDAPKTDYLFFVAKSDFSGYHTFANNYADHLKYAHQYQLALDELIKRKQQRTDSK